MKNIPVAFDCRYSSEGGSVQARCDVMGTLYVRGWRDVKARTADVGSSGLMSECDNHSLKYSYAAALGCSS